MVINELKNWPFLLFGNNLIRKMFANLGRFGEKKTGLFLKCLLFSWKSFYFKVYFCFDFLGEGAFTMVYS